MQVSCFSTRPYDREFLAAAAAGTPHRFDFNEARLDRKTVLLAHGSPAVCCFVEDTLDGPVLEALASGGSRFVVLRSTGFNNVDIEAARRLGLGVARVSRYSPHAVAEFALGMMLSLNRKLHRAYYRTREGNFLLDGLLGFDFHGRAVGVVGTGRIGGVMARILLGLGCRVLATDPVEDPGLAGAGVVYVDLFELLRSSDVVTLHVPLTPETRYLIDARTLGLMKPGAMLVNTSRGALVDTRAVIAALKSGRLGAAGFDVYEEEESIYYRDLSETVIADDVLMRLMTFPNVMVTGHQAFFTREALAAIARTTIGNLDHFEAGTGDENLVVPPAGAGKPQSEA